MKTQMRRLGSARLGSARLGSARLGSARLGSARLGSARLGSARLGSARLGSARRTYRGDGQACQHQIPETPQQAANGARRDSSDCLRRRGRGRPHDCMDRLQHWHSPACGKSRYACDCAWRDSACLFPAKQMTPSHGMSSPEDSRPSDWCRRATRPRNARGRAAVAGGGASGGHLTCAARERPALDAARFPCDSHAIPRRSRSHGQAGRAVGRTLRRARGIPAPEEVAPRRMTSRLRA